jgi:hypothetical protein
MFAVTWCISRAFVANLVANLVDGYPAEDEPKVRDKGIEPGLPAQFPRKSRKGQTRYSTPQSPSGTPTTRPARRSANGSRRRRWGSDCANGATFESQGQRPWTWNPHYPHRAEGPAPPSGDAASRSRLDARAMGSRAFPPEADRLARKGLLFVRRTRRVAPGCRIAGFQPALRRTAPGWSAHRRCPGWIGRLGCGRSPRCDQDYDYDYD